MININNVVIRGITSDSVSIEWDSIEGGTSQIEYGSVVPLGSLIPVIISVTIPEPFSYFHITKINNLLPGSTYNFRIKAIDRDGLITYSNNFTFTTLTQVQLESAIRLSRLDGGLPKIYFISPSGNDLNNGLSEMSAWATLKEAVKKVDVGDTIRIMPGTWTGQKEAILTKSGKDFAPIKIEAYDPLNRPIFTTSPNPIISTSVIVSYAETTVYSNISDWDISGLIIKNMWRPLFFNWGSNHIIVDNCSFDNNSSAFYVSNDSHHIIARNLAITNTLWNAVFIQNGSNPITGTHHILCDNVNVSLQKEHSFFDIHSNNDVLGINQSYITLWNCTAYDSINTVPYNSAPIYIHPFTGMDKYIAIINFKARNAGRMVLDLLSAGDSLYVDGLEATNTMGINIETVSRNTVIKNVLINLANSFSTYGSAGHGVYLWATSVQGLKFENVQVNNVNTAAGYKAFYNGTPNIVTGLEIINSFGLSTTIPGNLQNGSFDTVLFPWVLDMLGGIGSAAVINGEAMITISSVVGGTNKFYQSNLSLKPNTNYSLKFDVHSSNNAIIEGYLNDSVNYGLLYLAKDILTSSIKTPVRFDFITPASMSVNTTVRFKFPTPGTYYIDNVLLEEIIIPPPPPPCISNWQCEQPLNGYEADGCGNRRLNATCNPCIPNWQCEQPPNGYESDGCGNRRPNVNCNPCISNWKCEIPLNGYEVDGCGNRKLNSLCNPLLVLSRLVIDPTMIQINEGQDTNIKITAIDSNGVVMAGVPIVMTSNPSGIIKTTPSQGATFTDGTLTISVHGLLAGLTSLIATSNSVVGISTIDVNVAPPPPPPPPIQKWKCTGPPDFTCIQTIDGVYVTQAECQAACQKPKEENATQVIFVALALGAALSKV